MSIRLGEIGSGSVPLTTSVVVVGLDGEGAVVCECMHGTSKPITNTAAQILGCDFLNIVFSFKRIERCEEAME